MTSHERETTSCVPPGRILSRVSSDSVCVKFNAHPQCAARLELFEIKHKDLHNNGKTPGHAEESKCHIGGTHRNVPFLQDGRGVSHETTRFGTVTADLGCAGKTTNGQCNE